jgi:hypothetical protein
MASAALIDDFTLAPFDGVYGRSREPDLLSDDYFLTRIGRWAVHAADIEPPLPHVVQPPDKFAFEDAVSQWLADIEFDSLPGEMMSHPSFKAITDQGPRIVPLIAAHLRKSPSFLFLALEQITHENPVPADAYGNLRDVVAAWLKWLRS